MTERSTSRGREYQSSGRGGLGNIRPTSIDENRAPIDGPDDFSPTRGREFAVDPTKIHSTGRGGFGNIRSPSRPREGGEGLDEAEKKVIRERMEEDENAPHSFGRGGLGNMSRSKSRDLPSGSPQRHSTGRGGFGNMTSGAEPGIEEASAESEDKIHSTGRGGAANFTTTHTPAVEHPQHVHPEHEYVSSGRGGAGNIRERSPSRPREDGERSRSKVGEFLHKVTHPRE